MIPRTERNRRRDQTARLPGRWRRLGAKRDRKAAPRRAHLDDREADATDRSLQ